MTFFKTSKTQKLHQKQPKTTNSKHSKCYVRRPQIKFSEIIQNGIFKNFKNSNYPQNTKKTKIQKHKKVM